MFAHQLNLFFYCVFVTLILVLKGSRQVSNNEESPKNIIKLLNMQDGHFNPPVEDVMLSDNTDCDCGPNSVECSTLPDGGRKCKCKDGYAPLLKGKDESCEKCDCGNNGIQCKLFPSVKFCRCKLGKYTDSFITKNDRKCKECDCGPNGVSCEFSSGKTKFCKCKDGYASEKIAEDDNDEYCKRCDCGIDGKCNVKVVENRSVKQCDCYSGYKEFEGKCKRCDCGQHSVNCTFYKYKGTQICGCEEGYVTKESYVFRDEYCDRCDCGEFGVSCSFLFGNRRCTCKEGYTSDVIAGNSDDYCVKDTWLSGWVIGIFAVAGCLLLTVAGIVAFRLIARSRSMRR